MVGNRNVMFPQFVCGQSQVTASLPSDRVTVLFQFFLQDQYRSDPWGFSCGYDFLTNKMQANNTRSFGFIKVAIYSILN